MNAPHTVYAGEFPEMKHHLPGAAVPWINALRTDAIDAFMALGFPGTRLEEWKYTDLRSLARHHFTPSATAVGFDATALQPWLPGNEPAHRLVFVDGHFTPELCPFNTLLDGVTITSLASVLDDAPDVLENVLGQNAGLEQPGFNAFNTAFMTDGAFIDLSAGAILELPIHLVFITTGIPETLSTVRNVVIAGANSRASIVESYIALQDATCLTSTVTEIITGEGADIEHYKLEQEGPSAFHLAGIYVRQGRDSRFTSHNITLGGRLVRNDLHVDLDDTGAECTLNGLYLTRGRQHVDNHTWIDHNKPQATSNEWYKGVLDGHSRAVFNGRVVVHQDAQHTTAQQTNHNLLLSGDAEVDAKPQLEIYADDVKCAHGCTVGQLDAEALYYLRTRAVDEATARSMLVYAFAADILERIRLQPVRQLLEQELAARLMDTGALRLQQEQAVH
ncbi:MAG: Fe-S cluster assembly protein SufD [Pseudomonadota bacterium]